LRSFACAFRGIAVLILGEPNARLHAAAAVTVTLAGAYFRLSAIEWALIVGCIVAVIAAEAFNTAIESLADAVMPGRHPLIRRAKDIAAGGVLLIAIGAAIVGAIVFYPHADRLIADLF
jgi:diacylglycerol kinase (ATP)